MIPSPKGSLPFLKSRPGRTLWTDPRSRVLLSAAASLACNSLYAFYHGVLGVLQTSLWLLSLCAFYSILAVLRFCAILCGRRSVGNTPALPASFVLKTSGFLFFLLSAVLAVVNAISLSQNIAAAYSDIVMITIATYTFCKMAAVIGKAVRQRKNPTLLFAVLRNISYAEVSASVLTLQRSMLVSFGGMEKAQIRVMNGITGAAVCLFIFSLGILMIIRSGKDNESWQNQNL